MELIDFKSSSCKDCCDSKTKIEACASGKPVIIYLDEATGVPVVTYVLLSTGAVTTTAPAELLIGNCTDIVSSCSTEEVIQGATTPAIGSPAPTGSKLFFDTVTQKITRANVDGVWVEIVDSSLTFSNTLATGNKILTITDSQGNETDVYETITDVTAITNGFSYKNEAGVSDDITFEINDTDPLNTKVEVKLNGTKVAEFPLYTVDNDIQINNAGSEWSLTDDQITIVETNGDTQVLNFPYRVTVVANPDGSIDIKQNGVTVGTVPAQTVTTLTSTVTGHKIGTYTNESGVAVDINETITSVSDLSIAGNVITLKFVDETGTENTKTVTVPSDVITTISSTVTGNAIATYKNEAGTDVTINETITSIGTISYNSTTGVLTIPYTDEAGVLNNKTVTLPTALNVLTTTQPTPTATGNTTNLNSTFKDAAGNTWIVDSNGDAIQAGSALFKEQNRFYVDPNGVNTANGANESPVLTITKALTLLGAGDSVIVNEGVYPESFTMSVSNSALTGASSSYPSLSQISGTATVTGTGTSKKISDVSIDGIVKSGSASLYVSNTTVNTTLSSSAGYLEVKDGTIQEATTTITGGTALFEDVKIGNITASNAGTAVFFRNVSGGLTSGLPSTVTIGAGVVYIINDCTDITWVINAAAVPGETAALAQGATAEIAKEIETSTFQKLRLLRPDTNVTPTDIVTLNPTTMILERSPIANVSGDKYATTSTTCHNITTASGDITIQVSPGLAYIPLQTIVMIDATDSTKHMHCDIVSYNKVTGVMVVNVKQKSGSNGTICNWVVGPDSFNVTATVVTVEQDNTTGKQIGSVTVNGTTTDLYETVTSIGTLTYSGNTLTIPYVDENGVTNNKTVTINGGGSWTTSTTDPALSNNIAPLPRFVENSTNGSKWYIDATGVAKLIEGAADGCGTVYFDSVDPTTATIFDDENPPIANDDALKNLDCAVYIGTDGSVWSSNGTTYKTKVYSYPLHQREVVIATAGQTIFTLTKTPIGGTEKVHVSRNGVDISRAFTWVGAVGTYTPANNYGCTFDLGDTVQFHFEAF